MINAGDPRKWLVTEQDLSELAGDMDDAVESIQDALVAAAVNYATLCLLLEGKGLATQAEIEHYRKAAADLINEMMEQDDGEDT